MLFADEAERVFQTHGLSAFQTHEADHASSAFLRMRGAPHHVDAIGKRPRLAGALAAITAAVVGVILNLSVWFGLHVLFGKVERFDGGWFKPWNPDWAHLDWFALGLSLVAALALLRFHLGIIKTLMLCAALGAVWRLLT